MMTVNLLMKALNYAISIHKIKKICQSTKKDTQIRRYIPKYKNKYKIGDKGKWI